MREIIVSTCGTSVLTNGAGADLRAELLGIANAAEHDLTPAQRATLDQRCDEVVAALESSDVVQLRRASAELNALFAHQAEQSDATVPVTHILLVSDTAQGERVGALLEAPIRRHWPGATVEVRTVRDLAMASRDQFRSATGELVRFCVNELAAWRGSDGGDARVVFNLTGGFKGTQGLLHSLGTLYADEIVYIFQQSEELLHLPRLPVRVDLAAAVEDHEMAVRRLGVYGWAPASECSGLPETLVEVLDGRAELAAVWGEAAWRELEHDHYRTALLEPLSDRVAIEAPLRAQVAALEPDRRREVNRRIDQLSRLLDDHAGDLTSASRSSPRSLSLKTVTGLTGIWQLYAWSDGDASRLYGRWVNGRFVLGHLGAHLRDGALPEALLAYQAREPELG